MTNTVHKKFRSIIAIRRSRITHKEQRALKDDWERWFIGPVGVTADFMIDREQPNEQRRLT